MLFSNTHNKTFQIDNNDTNPKKSLYDIFLVIILIVAIFWRIFKGINTGILYDEIWTYNSFSADIHTALTNYTSTNNHILHSVIVALMRKLEPSFPYFLRIPTIACSVIFCILVYKTIILLVQNKLVQAIMLVFILQNRLICDLSFLARGYSYSMTAVAALLLLVIKISKTQETACNWKFIPAIILLNSIAIGAMASSAIFMMALNLSFFFLLVKECVTTKSFKKTIIQIVCICIFSTTLILATYWQVIPTMKEQANAFGSAYDIPNKIHKYLTLTLFDPIASFNLSTAKEKIISRTIGYLLFASIIISGIFILVKHIKTGNIAILKSLFLSPLVMSIIISLIAMTTQLHIFKISLGMPRNSVFLLYLFLLAIAILLDLLAGTICKSKYFFRFFLFLLIPLFITNSSSLYSIKADVWEWTEQGIFGPLSKHLKSLDSNKDWVIHCDPGVTSFMNHAICKYYSKFGYKTSTTEANNCDLWLVSIRPNSNPIVEKEFEFSKKYHRAFKCYITLEPSPTN